MFLGWHARDLAGYLGRVFFDGGLEFLEILGPLGDKVFVLPALAEDDMHQAVEQGDVGARLVLQEQVGIVGDVDAARVGHDQLGPPVPLSPAGSWCR